MHELYLLILAIYTCAAKSANLFDISKWISFFKLSARTGTRKRKLWTSEIVSIINTFHLKKMSSSLSYTGWFAPLGIN
jgi:hypothetical protein